MYLYETEEVVVGLEGISQLFIGLIPWSLILLIAVLLFAIYHQLLELHYYGIQTFLT